MGDMQEFFTREVANEGIKLPLALPDGTETEHFLVIRGVDSDAFREAQTKANRNAVVFAALEDETARNAALENEKRELIASLVASWSFDQECTPETVKTFLTEAPQIADQIDQIASKRAFFFKKKPNNSTATSNPKST